MEEWRPIQGFPRYEVSSLGNVRGKFGKLLNLATNRDGYKYITLHGEQKKTVRVHRLVASAFLPNPDNKPTVDHMNRDRSDNRLENLRYASWREQNLNAVKTTKLGQRYIRFNHGAYYCYYDKSNTRRFETLEEAIQYRDTVLSQRTADES